MILQSNKMSQRSPGIQMLWWLECSTKPNLFRNLIYYLESIVIVIVKSLSRVRLFATPWTVANGAPPSMGFSRQEYWSGLPFPSPPNELRTLFFKFSGIICLRSLVGGFSGGSVVKNLPVKAEDTSLIPSLGGSHMLWSS